MSNHVSPEQMVLLDQPYTQFEELEGLSDSDLHDIAALCPEETLYPDECVPCRAFVILADREEFTQHPEFEEYDEVVETPKLDALMAEESPFRDDPNPATQVTSEIPVVERFANQVRVLSHLVDELLEGPPIPPPHVSMDELAVLVYASEKWVTLLEAQGLELSDKQQAIHAEVRRILAKVRRD